MGDMSIRSISPTYHLSCAFQLLHDVTKEQLIEIKNGVFISLDGILLTVVGGIKNRSACESTIMILIVKIFSAILTLISAVIYNNHFQIIGYNNKFGDVEDSALVWHFNNLVLLQGRRRFTYKYFQNCHEKRLLSRFTSTLKVCLQEHFISP